VAFTWREGLGLLGGVEEGIESSMGHGQLTGGGGDDGGGRLPGARQFQRLPSKKPQVTIIGVQKS